MSEIQRINKDAQLFEPDDFKLTLINKGINSEGNRWFVFAKPDGTYAFMYKNLNGKSLVASFNALFRI